MSIPMDAALSAQPRTCYAHPDVPHTGRCDRCERPICETCAFNTAAGRLCPECMVSGAAPDQGRKSATLSVVSLVCAAGFVLCLLMMLGFVGSQAARGLAGTASIFLVLTGITTALLGRDYGRRTGSPISLIAVIANGVLFGIYVLLIVIGLTRGHR
jgi:hypothetical protein